MVFMLDMVPSAWTEVSLGEMNRMPVTQNSPSFLSPQRTAVDEEE